jgi:hypothetical protein
MIRKKSATVNVSPAPGFTPREISLMHPTLHVPAVATSTNYYRHAGRAIGLVLVFADGHTASLSYREIGELEDALQPKRESSVPAGYTWQDANAELFS